jgi:hypothetical protein
MIRGACVTMAIRRIVVAGNEIQGRAEVWRKAMRPHRSGAGGLDMASRPIFLVGCIASVLRRYRDGIVFAMPALLTKALRSGEWSP